MSHQVQLSPAESHRPTAVLDPAWHAAEPSACRSRCPYSPGRTGHVPDTSHPWKSDLHGHLSHLRQRLPDKPEDRQAGPIRAVLPRFRHLPAGRPDFPRRGKRPEDTAGTWRAASHTGPSGQRSASKAHDRDQPARYPGATCHRPPRDRATTRCRPTPTTTPGIRFCREQCIARINAYCPYLLLVTSRRLASYGFLSGILAPACC
jgi:hypothetical protein